MNTNAKDSETVCEFCGNEAVAIIEHEYAGIPGQVTAIVCQNFLTEYEANTTVLDSDRAR